MLDLETTLVASGENESDRVELLISLYEHAESGYVVIVEERKTLGDIYKLVTDFRFKTLDYAFAEYLRLLEWLNETRLLMSSKEFKDFCTTSKVYGSEFSEFAEMGGSGYDTVI